MNFPLLSTPCTIRHHCVMPHGRLSPYIKKDLYTHLRARSQWCCAEPIRRHCGLLMEGCRPISLITSHAHSEFAALQAEPARIRYAPSRCWGCRPIRIKRKDDSLVNKFPILSSFLFILTRLVAYPKYLSSNPLRAFPCLASSLAIS